nr:MAG TPA: hypothetical protein [Caudoviricetes sp.]
MAFVLINIIIKKSDPCQGRRSKTDAYFILSSINDYVSK